MILTTVKTGAGDPALDQGHPSAAGAAVVIITNLAGVDDRHHIFDHLLRLDEDQCHMIDVSVIDAVLRLNPHHRAQLPALHPHRDLNLAPHHPHHHPHHPHHDHGTTKEKDAGTAPGPILLIEVTGTVEGTGTDDQLPTVEHMLMETRPDVRKVPPTAAALVIDGAKVILAAA